ncbi:MAG: undecaprenyl-diphosphate phosphatase [Alphaproteobacteria bacterium]|nr:undecaprenyl-diphosphate phosphatase [Alphaproteobacteria bacterium]
MDSFLTPLFLGFVEGLTEFIPVSSTGHLLLLTHFLGFSSPDHVFEVFIQLGAILAVVVAYWRKWLFSALGFVQGDATARRFVFNLIAATIPAVIVGLIGRDWIKANLYNPFVIAVALVIGGLIILWLERRPHRETTQDVDAISRRTALMIGCFQAIAMIPGVSRSGATIMGGLALGLSRATAAEFSFFAAVPVMVAAVGYDTLKSWEAITSQNQWDVMLLGFGVAFVTALFTLKIAMRIISRFGFAPFAVYRIALGIFVLALLL